MYHPNFQKVFKLVTDIATHFRTDQKTALLNLAPRQVWTICAHVLGKRSSHDTGIVDTLVHEQLFILTMPEFLLTFFTL